MGRERSTCDVHEQLSYLWIEKERPAYELICKGGSTCQNELELGVG